MVGDVVVVEGMEGGDTGNLEPAGVITAQWTQNEWMQEVHHIGPKGFKLTSHPGRLGHRQAEPGAGPCPGRHRRKTHERRLRKPCSPIVGDKDPGLMALPFEVVQQNGQDV